MLVYLNGEFLPLEKAHVSVMDRGFLLGDGVYEVIPVYSGNVFRFNSHIKRLRHSLNRTGIKLDLSRQALADIIDHLIAHNTYEHTRLSAYIHITRGVVAERAHVFDTELEPTVFVKVNPIKLTKSDKGLKAVCIDDIRWRCCDIKSMNRLANVLMSQQAKQMGADEAILKEHNLIVEGATSNVFICNDGVISTPKLSSNVLPGITREMVCQLAIEHSIPLVEKEITHHQLLTADEVWISSSSREVAAVIEVDKQCIADGKPGPMQQQMLQLYRRYIDGL